MANKDIAARSSGAHHQVDDRQRPEDVVVEPEEKDGGIFFVKHGKKDDGQPNRTRLWQNFAMQKFLIAWALVLNI